MERKPRYLIAVTMTAVKEGKTEMKKRNAKKKKQADSPPRTKEQKDQANMRLLGLRRENCDLSPPTTV